MADEQALDDAIAALTSKVTEAVAAAQTILDKVSNLPNAPDLSDEIATIQGLGDQLSASTQAMRDAVTAPEPPAEPPVEEPPVEGEQPL